MSSFLKRQLLAIRNKKEDLMLICKLLYLACDGKIFLSKQSNDPFKGK